MKINKYIIPIFIAAFFLNSCDDYLDVNNNPTQIGSENISLSVLLPTVIEATAAAYQSAGISAQLVTHHLDNVQSGYYQRFTCSGAWDEIYLKSLNNLETMDQLATSSNSPHYKGVGKILRAMNLGLLTDTWENAPVDEAGDGSSNISPTYNTQEEIYTILLSDLSEAIDLLNTEESTFSPENDDLFYAGDLSQWIKVAHSLSARYQIHLNNKASVDYSEILGHVDNGLASNEDDFELYYPDNLANPWYDAIARLLTQSISTQTYGRFYIDLMNGEQYGLFDPRLPIIADTLSDSNGEYRGLASYIDDKDYTVSPTNETFYMQPSGPLSIMSYAELKFIEAEAALSSGNQTRANEAYREGIRSHFNKLGITDPITIDQYLQSPTVDIDVDLEHLMKEKTIALIFNYEAWNDMRRYHFNPSIFKGFVEPDLNGRSEPAQRAEYPTSELTRNPTNADANKKSFTTPMWKDQN